MSSGLGKFAKRRGQDSGGQHKLEHRVSDNVGQQVFGATGGKVVDTVRSGGSDVVARGSASTLVGGMTMRCAVQHGLGHSGGDCGCLSD